MRIIALLAGFLVAAQGVAAQSEPPSPSPADRAARVQARERLREGQRRMASDAFVEAAKEFEAAVALDPLLFMGHYGLGTALMGLKEYAAAISAFEGARTAFHDPVSVGNRIETDKARQRRIHHLRQLIANTAASGPATGTGARQESAQGNARHAELQDLLRANQESERVRDLPPGLSLALGSAYFRTGHLADAEREYRAAIAAQPALGEPRSNLAVVLLITGRKAEAKEQLELAKKTGFTPPRGLEDDIGKALVHAPSNTP